MARGRIAARTLIALAIAAPAEAGLWGDLKHSFGTAVDNAKRDGAKAVDAIGDAAGGAVDAAADGAQNAADYVAGDQGTAEDSASHPIDGTEEPITDGSKQLTKQPKE